MHLYNNVWKEILNMIYQIGEKRRFVLLAFRLVQIWYGRYIQYPLSMYICFQFKASIAVAWTLQTEMKSLFLVFVFKLGSMCSLPHDCKM